ncbi:alpha-1,2-fucosyltransferase [Spirosoma radiotolerans]|uniref:Glycosyl transferase family 11 n=1 Tax=Spirosoma radiotolerans TaxID=1379870 RepID=A0A0E3ZYU8_9BACT|nr:alpha-1,2-fucosyltransferase [Spirosoma radiotolerans]AKD57880.1 hypothetical protein SD10_26225 [Spirosoma radiotolerans]
MVISVLAGGLGNQLFQYAFGFSLAQQRKTELRLERHLLESRTLARLRNYTPRQYELSVFGIDQLDSSLYDTLRCLSRTLLPGQQAVLLRESAPATLTSLTQSDTQLEDAFCVGYWQSESYFKPVEVALRQQLTVKKPLSNLTLRMAETIFSSANATFVHIRRGDYITNTKANRHHGVCGEAYYRRAVEYLHQQASDIQFFVFSDDQAWVKRELGALLSPAIFVEHNTGVDSWQDMYLMSLCRHAIVANSSFSWWGAWLNPDLNRIVVAPQQWFAVNRLTQPAVAPSHWITV